MKGIGMEPEPVHKIEVRAEGRQGICVTANERSKETVLGEPGNPMGKGRRSQAFGNHKEKKDKGTQDLRLILSGSAGMVVKRQDNSMVQAIVILFASVGIIGLIVGDIMMTLLDPRISFAGKKGSR